MKFTNKGFGKKRCEPLDRYKHQFQFPSLLCFSMNSLMRPLRAAGFISMLDFQTKYHKSDKILVNGKKSYYEFNEFLEGFKGTAVLLRISNRKKNELVNLGCYIKVQNFFKAIIVLIEVL